MDGSRWLTEWRIRWRSQATGRMVSLSDPPARGVASSSCRCSRFLPPPGVRLASVRPFPRPSLVGLRPPRPWWVPPGPPPPPRFRMLGLFLLLRPRSSAPVPGSAHGKWSRLRRCLRPPPHRPFLSPAPVRPCPVSRPPACDLTYGSEFECELLLDQGESFCV